MIIISNNYTSFDNQKVEIIVKELIENKTLFSTGLSTSLYWQIQKAANRLGYMDIAQIDLGNKYILTDEDYMKIADKIWEYISSGILAPGSNKNNPWFPHLHLTEKGKKLLEK